MSQETAQTEPTWAELAPRVDDAVAELPEEVRVPVILHFLEGKSQTEIAQELDINQSTVSRRIEKGLSELREKLRQAGGVASVAVLGTLLSEHAAAAAPAALLTSLGKMAMSGVGQSATAAGAAAEASAGAAAGAPATVASTLFGAVGGKVAVAVAISALAVAGVVAYRTAARPDPSAEPTTPAVPIQQAAADSSAEAAAALIQSSLRAMQARLVGMKGQYPQLSELGHARLEATRLEYKKGEVSWPEGKMGGPRFSVKDGCHLQVTFRYPVETEPTVAAGDQGAYCPYAGLFCSFLLFSDPDNPGHDAFEKDVRDIVMRERAKLAEQLRRPRLDRVCRALKAQAGGEWEPGMHNGFRYGVLVVRGRLRDASGKTVATYHVLPIGAGVDRYGQTALGMYGKVQTKVSLLGIGPRFTVVEFLEARENEAVKKARAALVKTLELSPPRITVDMYRRVLAAAERALERAQGKSLPDVAPARRNSIAVGQTPFIEERDGAFRFVWEMITSSKTGFRVTGQRGKEGEVSILEVTLGL